jgi:hypothetical protein
MCLEFKNCVSCIFTILLKHFQMKMCKDGIEVFVVKIFNATVIKMKQIGQIKQRTANHSVNTVEL